MTVDKSFLVKKVMKKTSYIMAICTFTNMPFVICDPETFDDQVWFFESEPLFREFEKTYAEKKIGLKGLQYKNVHFQALFRQMYLIGVNQLVFVNEVSKTVLEVEDLVPRPSYEGVPKEQIPITNPQLQLTGLYFVQEATRPVPDEEKENIRDLFEELNANLAKGTFLVPVEVLEGPGSLQEKLKNRSFKLPLVKWRKEFMLQPIFTDMAEYQKVDKEKKFTLLHASFPMLSRMMAPTSQGFLLNPGGFHIPLLRQANQGESKASEPSQPPQL